MPRIVIAKGPGVGRDHAIGTECVVGRAPEVDFVLEDVGASRRHFRVSRDGDGYVLEDLGSRNGTSVNGARVQRIALRDGDAIRVGATEMVFRQKDTMDAGEKAARPGVFVAPKAVVVPRAVVVPKAVVAPAAPKAPAAPAAPGAPAAPAEPAKKPLIAPVPRRKRVGW